MQRKWTELPVPNDVISRVEEMSLSPEDNLGRILNESEKEEGSSNNSDEASQDLDIQESEDRINIDEDISGINNGDMGETNDVEAEEVNDTNYENQGIEIEDLGIQNKENENEEKIHIQDDKENGVKTSNHKYDLRPNRTLNSICTRLPFYQCTPELENGVIKCRKLSEMN